MAKPATALPHFGAGPPKTAGTRANPGEAAGLAEAAKLAAASQPAADNDLHPSADEITLLKQWNTLQGGFRRLTCLLLDDVEAKAAVPPSSFQVLWFLLTAPDRTARMHQLAHTLGFSTAGTTKVADRLAEAGLIERCPSPADRRVIFATLTERGTQVAGTAALALAEALRDRVVRPLGAGALEALAAAIAPLDPREQAETGPLAGGDAAVNPGPCADPDPGPPCG